MAELRPPLLDEYGLGAALGWYAEEFSRRTGIAVALRDGEDAAAGLRPEAAVALFRIAQEALNNVAKHAGARQVRIELAGDAEEIVMRVVDDGAGFDPAAAARGKRWGMKTMRERAEAAGAAGYVVKRSAAKEVVEAIRAVHAGQRYLSPRVADVVIDDYAEERDDPLARLSAREREVLQLLAEGRTGAEIAQRLSLSQKTVETYRARLVEKLGIRDVAGLVRFAIQRGLVSLE